MPKGSLVNNDVARSADLHRAPDAPTPTPALPVALLSSQEPDSSVLFVQGSIVGTALDELCAAMELVLRSHERRIVVDVNAVERWSMLAQAMILATARRMAARGEQLVLRGPSAELREQSRRLDLFRRVLTIDLSSENRQDTNGVTGIPARSGVGQGGGAGG